jgi:hypothetical protein
MTGTPLLDWQPRYPNAPGSKVPGPSQEAGEGTGSLALAPISHGNGGFA